MLLGCAKETSEQTVIIVKVPPFYDKKYSKFGNYLRFQDFLFPPKRISKDEIYYPDSRDTTPLPNNDGLLYVSIDESGLVTLNNESYGTVSDTKRLTETLKFFFQERTEMKVFEPESNNIVKAVGIKTAHSVKYGDFFNVVEAVKQSGAEPIVLLFDDDARPKSIIKLNE